MKLTKSKLKEIVKEVVNEAQSYVKKLKLDDIFAE